MTDKEIIEKSEFDLLKIALNESLESHKPYKSEYWRGSRAMIENVLYTMNIISNKRNEILNKKEPC